MTSLREAQEEVNTFLTKLIEEQGEGAVEEEEEDEEDSEEEEESKTEPEPKVAKLE